MLYLTAGTSRSVNTACSWKLSIERAATDVETFSLAHKW